MDPSAAGWFARSTSWRDWPVQRVLAAKQDVSVAVVIPARDEEATIGPIVAGIEADLVACGLVDELVVIDSDSTDDTGRLARDAGAAVFTAASIRPELGSLRGKGEALWKSQFVTTSELLVFVDADLTQWGTHFVTGLLGPLLTDRRVELVKGYYDRLLEGQSSAHSPQGGRVTELVARPLLNLYRPELSAVVQPLAGEWAIRRDTFAALSVPTGYGVELATLLDVTASAGLDAVAQVDLGSRAHAHQSVHDLGVMAAELLAVAGRRIGAAELRSSDLWQFDRAADPPWLPRPVPITERPPADSIPRSADAATG